MGLFCSSALTDQDRDIVWKFLTKTKYKKNNVVYFYGCQSPDPVCSITRVNNTFIFAFIKGNVSGDSIVLNVSDIQYDDKGQLICQMRGVVDSPLRNKNVFEIKIIENRKINTYAGCHIFFGIRFDIQFKESVYLLY